VLQEISIAANEYAALIDYLSGQLPYEGCAALIGFGGGTDGPLRIVRIRPLANVAPDNRRGRFVADPREWTTLLFEAPTDGARLLGLAHSHPSAAPAPSAEDAGTLWHTLPTHWIVSFTAPARPVVRAYQIRPCLPAREQSLRIVHG